MVKSCVWCDEDVSNETTYGFLTYWNKQGSLRSGYWHPECWDKYWEIRKRTWYKKLWDKIRGLSTTAKRERK